MNDKIRMIMEQAGLYDFVVESMGIDGEIEKFAELIVEECAKTVEDSQLPDTYSEPALKSIANDIRKKFGVKDKRQKGKK